MKQMWQQIDTWAKGIQVCRFEMISKWKGLLFLFCFEGEWEVSEAF